MANKGFASFLLLFLVSGILVLTAKIETIHFESGKNPEISLLSLRRLEIEKGIDEIISNELHTGIVLHENTESIQNQINQKIGQYLQTFPSQQKEPINYETGFATLHQTNYQSLQDENTIPFSIEELNSNSLVLILPIDEENWYGEYAYTGGTFGSSILLTKMKTKNTQTFFALPSGYRACATTLLGKISCVTQGEK